MIFPKIIRGQEAKNNLLIKNIDGTWYEARPTYEIWPEECKEPDVTGEYWGGYDCGYQWFPIGKTFPHGEFVLINSTINLYEEASYDDTSYLEPGTITNYITYHYGDDSPTVKQIKINGPFGD